MKMNQDRQYKQNLEANAFDRALREGIKRDKMMRSCFESDKPLSKGEQKHQVRLEKLLNEGCEEEDLAWQKESKLRAEASLRALKRGLMLGIKTE